MAELASKDVSVKRKLEDFFDKLGVAECNHGKWRRFVRARGGSECLKKKKKCGKCV